MLCCVVLDILLLQSMPFLVQWFNNFSDNLALPYLYHLSQLRCYSCELSGCIKLVLLSKNFPWCFSKPHNIIDVQRDKMEGVKTKEHWTRYCFFFLSNAGISYRRIANCCYLFQKICSISKFKIWNLNKKSKWFPP